MKKLSEYKKPDFKIEYIDIIFEIFEGFTYVNTTFQVIFDNDNNNSLHLDGVDLKPEYVCVNGENISINDYANNGKNYINIKNLGKNAKIDTKVKIYPEENTCLEGLYVSNDIYTTQCEAEAFRRITFFPDRPDVLTKYRVKIITDKNYSAMLSNGELVNNGVTDDGRKFVEYYDKHVKPSYLFALVVGDLVSIEENFITKNNDNVSLNIYSTKNNLPNLKYAMQCLKKVMKWDEDVWNLVYDSSVFNIVSIDDFNMGAMENKSLNIFNSSCLLYDKTISTDAEEHKIDEIIAHEYFHNWSGNRVTCRDWFQLSLKEGLTVFRDQNYSEDTRDKVVERINQVLFLRNFQFPEDQSTRSHAVRPDYYEKIDNFYTATVYDKGAELIRMMKKMMGEKSFYNACEKYFLKYDNMAVTCEDFVLVMADECGHINFDEFKNWYTTPGTPYVDIEYKNNSIKISQKILSNSIDNGNILPLPLDYKIFDKNGKLIKEDKDYILSTKEDLIEVENDNEFFISINRGFSCPCVVTSNLSFDNKVKLLSIEDDKFNFWDLSSDIKKSIIIDIYNDNYNSNYIDIYADILKNKILKAEENGFEYIGYLLDECSFSELQNSILKNINPIKLYEAQLKFKKELSEKLFVYAQAELDKYMNKINDCFMIRKFVKSLSNFVLNHDIKNGKNNIIKMYKISDNMDIWNYCYKTLKQYDFHHDIENDFIEKVSVNNICYNKFILTTCAGDNDIENKFYNMLNNNENFKITNPNNVRNLASSFTSNIKHFHTNNGYELFKEFILLVDKHNPQTAMRICTPLINWKQYENEFGHVMRSCLVEILNNHKISDNLCEIIKGAVK